MGFLYPDEYEISEEEWARLRKRLTCRHQWPEGADKTEVGCVNCGYRRMKEIDPDSPEGQAVLQQFLQSKPHDYFHLVAPVPLSEMADDEDNEYVEDEPHERPEEDEVEL